MTHSRRRTVSLGDLPAEHLALAAYCGHAGAMTMVGATAPPVNLQEWTAGLVRWPMAGERAAIAAVRFAIERNLDEASSRDVFAAAEAAVEAAQRWVECPCNAHARAAERSAVAAGYAWSGESLLAALSSAHFLGPHRASHIDSPTPQFVRAVTEAARGARDDLTLRLRMENTLLAWIGLATCKEPPG